MMEGAAGLFPKKIAVTLIDEISGKLIGEYKEGKDSLPQVYDRPMVIAANGQLWRVTKADPVSGKRLRLHVQENGYFLKHNKRSLVPTLAPAPETTTQRLAHNTTFEIKAEEWRQLEFLPAVMQEEVEEEIKLVAAVAGEGGLLGYDRIHVRENLRQPRLRIPFHEFYRLVNGQEKGCVQMPGAGVIENGFLIRSGGYVYYGQEKEQLITMLCLQDFDCADDEITKVIDEYDLMLVNWSKGTII